MEAFTCTTFRKLPAERGICLSSLAHTLWYGMGLPLQSPGEHGPSHLESDTAVLELNLHGDDHRDILIL